jgi:hypothetical protein
MAKKSKPKKDAALAIKGTFADVIKVSVTPKKSKKKKP